MAFGIWTAVSVLFLIIGIHTWFNSKPVYFWANDTAEMKVSDITAYNHAMAKLFFSYGILLLACGLPLLSESKAMLIITMLGTVFSTLVMICIYAAGIEPKYRQKA